ncbi:uncharacterized protein PV09_00046 [Verruconis gallopava]|uniref:Glycosyl hydrolase n=1 Tax=Verruconis gallopava TaxID=253628 RepID=A0A0D1Y237_9PEZI|nr:uncharacterized protein PV09_00046 [Verruconis gallopava]KIW09101.1 hypothetical protein PV09_00046 [Verruconis gallopava]
MDRREVGVNWRKKWASKAILALLVLLPLYSLWTFYTLPFVPNVLPQHQSPFNALEELHYALETMQNEYFQIWLGKWPTSIDWTGAVLGTLMSASLFSLTRSLDYVLPPSTWQPKWTTVQGEKVENEINRYFSQSIAYYFGEDAFSIRLQAYDDMLWVVLGWLEGIRFVTLHSNAHYPPSSGQDGLGAGKPWYGTQFIPSFAHRANVFYEIARQGWDTELCGGGMVWNPRLTPYKNAITNELYISASVGMYLYFPGDSNTSPYLQNTVTNVLARDTDETAMTAIERKGPHDPTYLSNAIKAYEWLKHSNMTNEKGLYVDGFHIAGWNRNGSIGTGNCDVRNEMVYTYNQGVLLSGLRNLWEATGKVSYLKDGHELVRNVIAATGWRSPTSRVRWWSGLGRNGVLEEICDASGTCSQNGQTFKGIFFHHLTLFCEPLPDKPLVPGKTYAADPATYSLHAQSCKEYAAWVVWNAKAALATRDAHGRFGMWWGVPNWDADGDDIVSETPESSEDYRNEGLGSEELWGVGWREGLEISPPNLPRFGGGTMWPGGEESLNAENMNLAGTHVELRKKRQDHRSNWVGSTTDLNDRGRGRTVETQGGGVAVLRAMWEFVRMYSD